MHTDFRATLKISGRVQDSSGAGLSDARVFFIDTGLDENRSRSSNRWIEFTGSSDAAGNVDEQFQYAWGSLQQDVSPPTGTFEIWIDKYGYRPYSQHFDIETVPRSGDEITIQLGTIQLNPR